MTEPAITVNNLGKSYRLGQYQRADNFRELLVSMAKAPFRRIRNLGEHKTGASGAFWALQDVSFEINPGEVVGIIGRNGAGKSTLLKMLSRITEPTKGDIELRGRVSSLLEVGTGFHPELTGRENIFLNGSILGMKRAEIKSKFDEIIAFAEVEKFLDTPVKRYSSGMYVRLAFAVAAHLEPEILIVDEVLAVGDLEFQKKCLGKMGEVAKAGRTVLIVSHNMSAIQSLCDRSILLRQGRLVADGPTDIVIKEYLSYLAKTADDPFNNNPERSGNGDVRFTAVKLYNAEKELTTHPISGKKIFIEMDYVNKAGVNNLDVILTIYNHLGVAVSHLSTKLTGTKLSALKEGRIVCEIDDLPLPLGEYRVAAGIQVSHINVDLIPNLLVFEITASSFFSTCLTPDIQYSAALMAHNWQSQPIPGS